ncbi:ATV_HP_G0159090.mRNA.1.CDS.1 [Saccharomyces cerevisiae]|nr:ATV_HP_G0159090.mRNA.1.CDS.1 [Saccharomyces cerevisiae]CAI6938432.1 ATV_HP_G0159090.mRNA.1.CDS.1 [Saccharomyces cerevisiae]
MELDYDQKHNVRKMRRQLRTSSSTLQKKPHFFDQSKVQSLNIPTAKRIVVLYYSLKLLDPKKPRPGPTKPPLSRVFTENRDTQVICIFAIGYFVWDIYISTMYSTFPLRCARIISPSCLHRIEAFQYAPVFLMFELFQSLLELSRWFGIKFLPQKNKFCYCCC